MTSRRRAGATCDFEEVRPGLFIIHNPALGPVLRGEGNREGDRFTLTSWRDSGLVGRLRRRNFVVLTLADQVAALPGLPSVAAPGPPHIWRLASAEQIHYFSADPLGWVPAPAVGPDEVQLQLGWILRRRRSRGAFTYHELRNSNLLPCTSDQAILLGYAQISANGPVPIEIHPAEDGAGQHLENLPLPSTHERLMGRVASHSRQGWHIPPASLPTVSALLARLGLSIKG